MMTLKYIATYIFLLVSYTVCSQDQDIRKITVKYKDTLELDYYSKEPLGNKPPPLLVLMHGGGFASGRRDGQGEVDFCRAMAEKGYSVVSISYRLTRKNDPFSCDLDTEKKIATFVSACEDLSDAVHFLNRKEELVFDRNNIILIGSSAGAEAVLHATFMSHHYRFDHIPKFSISGVISFSGAIINGAYISKSNAVPALFIHGKKDKTVPYDTAPHHYCTEDRPGFLMLDGPQTLTGYLKDLDGSFVLAFDPEGTHDVANRAYLETDLVDSFIQNLILEKKHIQSYIQLESEDNGK